MFFVSTAKPAVNRFLYMWMIRSYRNTGKLEKENIHIY